MLNREITSPIKLVLYIFRNECEEEQIFHIRHTGDIQQLLECLRNIEYDGATDLSFLARIKPSHVFDYLLLFSDGITSIGARLNPTVLKIASPMYTITSNLVHSASLLRGLAVATVSHFTSRYFTADTCQSQGGVFFNLQNSTVDHVLRTVGRPHFSFLGLHTELSGVNLETFPSRVTPLTRAQFIVTGKVTLSPVIADSQKQSNTLTVPIIMACDI